MREEIIHLLKRIFFNETGRNLPIYVFVAPWKDLKHVVTTESDKKKQTPKKLPP